jgi:hypothetical protein
MKKKVKKSTLSSKTQKMKMEGKKIEREEVDQKAQKIKKL